MTRCNYHALQDTYTMMEEQLSVISEKIADLKLNLEVSELDIDLDNLETQLIDISEKMDSLSLNVVIDSIDRGILLNIENRLSDINTQIDNAGVNTVGEISHTAGLISDLTDQLKIANQIALLKELDGIDAEVKQAQYEALKDLLFDADDVINQPSIDDMPNPIIDGGQG